MFRRFLLTMLFGIGGAEVALATTPARLVGESRRTIERLDEIAAAESQNQWGRAFDLSLRLIEQAGNDWVPVADGSRYVTVQRYLLERIGKDANMSRLFRNRFETRAADQLQNARARRDGKLLQQVAMNLGPTESAKAATEMLGDLSFEQGDFAQARHWWQKTSEQVLPANAATIRAKVLLAHAACRESIDQQLFQWKKEHPDAHGQLAGRDGKLIDILNEIVLSFQKTPAPKAVRSVWPDERRGRWQLVSERVRLSGTISSGPISSMPAFDRSDHSTAGSMLQPVIWRDHVLFAYGARISAIQLSTGSTADTFAANNDLAANSILDSHPRTMTVVGSRIMSRLAGTKKEPGGQIVCVDQDPSQESFRWRVIWQLEARSLNSAGEVSLEGTPISTSEFVYFSWSQTIGNRTTIWLSAYSHNRMADGPTWSVPIVELPFEAGRHRSQQVAIAGPHIVYSTDAGLIIAVNSDSGQPAWAFRYEPTQPRPMVQSPQRSSIGECLVWGGRIFVAPADTDRLFAFDQWTGQPVWPRPLNLNVTKIIGVIDNKLVVAANGQLRGVGAIEVATGRLDYSFGSLTSAAPFGNCELMSDRILIPTRHAGLVSVNRLGEPVLLPTILQQGTSGNVVCDGEYLIVASADAFSIFRYASSSIAKSARD